MITHIRIAAFPGSSGFESPKQKLLDGSVACALEAGAEVRSVYLQDADLPFSVDDVEDEDGIPSSAGNGRELIAFHHVLLIATPEPGGERTGPLENAIDWVRRVRGGAGSCLGHLVNKSASLISPLVSHLDEIRLQMAFRRALIKLGADAVPDANNRLKGNAANLQEKSKCNWE